MFRARSLPFLLLTLLAAAGCSRSADRVEVSPRKVKIYGLDRPQRLTARILDKRGLPLEIGTPNWESSKPAVATVDNAGLVSPKTEGKTVITARYNKVSASVPIEVVDVKSVEVSPASIRIVGPAGTAIPIRFVVKNSRNKVIALPPIWSSSKPGVATVSPAGLVTTVSRGVTVLIAKIGDVQGAAEVTADLRDLTRIEIHPATALVHVGDSQPFSVVAYGADGRPIEGAAAVFSSSIPTVATVNESGGAAGIGAGASTIRASIGNLIAEATLIVN